VAVHAQASRRGLRTFLLDAAVFIAALVGLVLLAFADVAAGSVDGLGFVLLLYPIFYLGLAGPSWWRRS